MCNNVVIIESFTHIHVNSSELHQIVLQPDIFYCILVPRS